jgi:two-component system phosphate regulon sensor histidine kinase PhoR
MVEKLLETASLESDNLKLSKEPLNIVQLLKTNVEKHLLNTSNKTIDFISNQKELILDVDAFHFENAISNLIDNALKYGGNQIEVCLKLDKKMIEITVQDNGIEIDKNQHEKIFEKFYRIPKGNIHDVKGFGIGLYYSKKIIEKHQGTLELIVNSKNIFKITLTHV